MAEAATLSRPPTFMRYQRVEQVLESEPRFKAQMTSKTEAVLKPNGEKQLFSPVVIQVTEAIHQNGQDAHKAQKMDIIRVAMEFFRPGRTAPERSESVQAPAPRVEPAAPVPPAAVSPEQAPAKSSAAKRPAPPKAAAKPKAAAAKPVSAAKPAAKPPVEQDGGDQAEADEAPVSVAPRVEPVASPAAARNGDGEGAKPEPRRTSASDPAYNPYISIFTQLLTALQLAENYDNQPGKDKRLKTLDDLAVEYRKFTGIPRNA